jgi:hypothetical protein
MPYAQSRRTPSWTAPRRAARRIASALVLLALVPLPASPEPRSGEEPDTADLWTYLECSVAAEVRLLGFDEVILCSTVFMRIKLSFVPDIDLDTFNGLLPMEKSAVDRLGYGRYLDWKHRNAAEIDALMTEIRASQADS